MTSANRSLVLVLAAIAPWLLPTPAAACSCMPPDPPEAELHAMDAVFLGTVTKVREGEYPQWAYHLLEEIDGRFGTQYFWEALDRQVTVDVAVDATWKGVTTSRTALYTSGTTCSYHFVEGEQYLIYAYRHEGSLHTGLCTRTARALQAEEDLEFLADLDQLPRAEVAPEPRLLVISALLIVVVSVALSLRLLSRSQSSGDPSQNSSSSTPSPSARRLT